MDALGLLRLQAETMWTRSASGLGCGTVHVVISTYDGRSELLPGSAPIDPGTVTTATQSRCWQLPLDLSLMPLPHNFSLATTGDQLPAPDTWAASDWSALLAGERGPWVALTQGGRMASLAHCARLSDTAAEVGVQTEPAFRGRGLAAMAVRAWVAMLAPMRRYLFYSAFDDNTASHRVAARCDATPIGRLCRLRIDG